MNFAAATSLPLAGVWTALVLAANRGHADVVGFLTQSGARAPRQMPNRKTPLDGDPALLREINGDLDTALEIFAKAAGDSIITLFRNRADMRIVTTDGFPLVVAFGPPNITNGYLGPGVGDGIKYDSRDMALESKDFQLTGGIAPDLDTLMMLYDDGDMPESACKIVPGLEAILSITHLCPM